jgi:precorrin isomerase
MENILHIDEGAVEKLYNKVKDGTLKTVVTDVTMVTSGIRKGALQRLGMEAKCYLNDDRVASFAAANNITRTQAGIRLAVEEHPDALFVFGNAPTALIRLTELIGQNAFRPELVIGVPVGFVNVVQSKEMLIASGIPCIVARGRKGGSNVAAAICNALLYLADKNM